MAQQYAQNKAVVFQDQFGRKKRKLRISLTDRCNFKCTYCMPEHPTWINKNQLLSFEELYTFCRFMVQRGIEHIRITGGEPLMRQGVVHFIAQLQDLRTLGLKRISMTTNAHYLKDYAQDLKVAGLDDLNISLDSLDSNQFFRMTQKDLKPVLAGIQAAQLAGFNIKINTVLIKGLNDNQIIPLTEWALTKNIQLRFIEFMPLDGDQKWTQSDVITEAEILTILKQHFQVELKEQQGSEPARIYHINDQRLGIISTISHGFCGQCDRLRLSAQGELFNCLFATQGLNLKSLIQQLKTINPATGKQKAHQQIPTSNGSVNAVASLEAGVLLGNTIDTIIDRQAELEQQLDHQLGAYIWKKESGFLAIQQRAHKSQNLDKTHLDSERPLQQGRRISMHMIGG